jgi:hypothetical protein
LLRVSSAWYSSGLDGSGLNFLILSAGDQALSRCCPISVPKGLHDVNSYRLACGIVIEKK